MPLRRSDIDTDQIIPAKFCRRMGRTGYADALFHGWREEPGYLLDRPEYVGASILIAGPRFGIGSSREHAVWALRDHGFRVVVAPSFGDIFRTNSIQNGLLTAQVGEDVVARLWELIEADPAREITVDLVARQIRAGGVEAGFELDDYSRWRLLEGLDDIDLTLRHTDGIDRYEQTRAGWLPVVRRPAASRTAALRPMALVDYLLLAREHEALDLATGTPSFPEPAPDLLAQLEYVVHNGHNQYENPAGNARLRELFAESMPLPTDPDTEVTVTVGATEGLNVAMQALIEPGDEVVILEPAYEAFAAAVRLASGVPRFVRLHAPQWTWEPRELVAAFGPRTRAVILNSPHNPTGRVFSAVELDQIAQLCERWDAYLVSDEVYADLRYQPGLRVPSEVTELAARTVVLRSLSKSHALSGWRVGCVRAPAAITRTVRLVHETLTAGTAAPLQAAIAEALRKGLRLDAAQLETLAAKRDGTVELVREIGLACDPPEGACYVVGRLPDGAPDAAEYARALIERHGVFAAPGGIFYAEPAHGERLMRFAFNKSDDILRRAAERLRAARDGKG